ncbi:MAG: ribose 5-phosphate isomerase B [Kofleriaceae bacterium]
MKWYAGSDHAGLPLKRALVTQLRALGDEVVDIGTDSEASVDYPEFGAEVGRRVVADAGSGGTLGLIVCGSGIGISIAANKVPGVRAALVHDAFTAEMARKHNDANVVAMGARVLGVGVAEHALALFRSTSFEGGRHQRRVDQLNDLGGALDAVRTLDRSTDREGT